MGDPEFLRRVASEMRHNRNLRGALELERIASGMEAGTAKTEGLGPKDDSPVAKPDAHT